MKRIYTILTVILLASTLIACVNQKVDDNEKPGIVDPIEPETPIDPVEDVYEYEGELMVGPFRVFNADGTIYETYDFVFDAIRNAGLQGTSQNLTYVLDSNDLQVFKRQAKNRYYMYDGMYYAGTDTSLNALNWSDKKTKSYVVDGQGVGFVKLGIELFEGSEYPAHVELNAGGYNYMFSKSGRMENGSWVEHGYGYGKTTIRLSEATYKAPTDGQTWNAYIFFNHKGKYNSDLGLIGTIVNGELSWRPVRNSSHPEPQSQGIGFQVLSNIPLTTMKPNEEGIYSGADDLTLEVFATADAWRMVITNIKTGYQYIHNEVHEGMHSDSTGYFTLLLAASLVPVTGNVWNSRNGSYLKNVIFEDIKIARYNGTYEYQETELEDFYPGMSNVLSGFSYAADTASHQYGSHKTDGIYKSGAEYKAGDKYLIFSSYYDGSESVKWA